jgi:carbamoyl-phosphate synthase large subunit
MKSVGEAMAIGRTFKEAFMKGVRRSSSGAAACCSRPRRSTTKDDAALRKRLAIPSDRRMWDLFRADRSRVDRRTVARGDPHRSLVPASVHRDRRACAQRHVAGARGLDAAELRRLKRAGFGDQELALALKTTETAVRERRHALGLKPVYKRVDTCAAEFESFTPYMYSSYEPSCESNPNPRNKVVILGSGPNRIGQGIEFDYCCLPRGLRAPGRRPRDVMVNCNPETVSTDYDTADRLYFQPLTFEDVMAVIETERSAGGTVSCLVQFGGQTPLKLALALQHAGVRILGTRPIRSTSRRIANGSPRLSSMEITQPASGTATSRRRRATPRPRSASSRRPASYVLGGRGMAIVYDVGTLDRYMTQAVDVSPEHPVLVDKFLEDAFEFDVDAIADAAGDVVIGGIMEHIEEAGIHSGDSSCVVPPFICPERHLATIRD